MPVLTIASRKGGCGKTTIATSLAAALAAEGVSVALLDADPNAGAYRWAMETYTGRNCWPMPSWIRTGCRHAAVAG